MFIIFSVFYILIAAAMIVLILMQRGAGADAGSGFGGGASGTVFGARGSATFLTRATGVLAGLFFLLSLGMGIYISRSGAPKPTAGLGVMAGAGKAPESAKPQASAPANAEVPAASKAAPADASSEVPAAQPPVQKSSSEGGSDQPKPAKN